MNTAELMDAARARSGAPSDYRLAKMMGVTSQLVSDWRHGRKYPTLLQVFQLAEMAQLDTLSTVVQIEEYRADQLAKPDQAEAWRKVLERIGGVAATVILSVATLMGASGANPASARVAGDQGGSSAAVDRSIHSARTRRRRSARAGIADAAAAALAALSPTRHASA